MKFNPVTRILYTDENTFIKKLSCPYNIVWEELSMNKSNNRHCDICSKDVIDIRYMDDNSVVDAVKKDASICFKVNIHDENIRVINHAR